MIIIPKYASRRGQARIVGPGTIIINNRPSDVERYDGFTFNSHAIANPSGLPLDMSSFFMDGLPLENPSDESLDMD